MSEKASPPATSASAQQLRKIKKPIIERRRRERINDSLNQLKALVLDALNKDESRYSKMEKADILEMTVRHLKGVQRQAPVAPPSDHTHNHPVELLGKYQAGFNECANEVSRYLCSMQGIGVDVQMRLLQHLSGRMQCSMTPTRQQQHQQHQAQQAQMPILTTAFHQQPSSPTATPITSLPGQLTINTANSPSPGLSPTLPTGANTANTPVIAVVSPTGLTSETMLRNAIPLYVTNFHPDAKPLLVSPPPQQNIAKPLDSRSAGSPQLGDEVPDLFLKRKMASSPVNVTKSHTSTGLYAHLPKAELCSQYAMHEYSSKSVWRPW